LSEQLFASFYVF